MPRGDGVYTGWVVIYIRNCSDSFVATSFSYKESAR
jgi:hypothetical protein